LRSETVSVWGAPTTAQVQVGDGRIQPARAALVDGQLSVTLAGQTRCYRVAENDGQLWIADARGTWAIREADEVRIRRTGETRRADIVSPMPGAVIAVEVDADA